MTVLDDSDKCLQHYSLIKSCYNHAGLSLTAGGYGGGGRGVGPGGLVPGGVGHGGLGVGGLGTGM